MSLPAWSKMMVLELMVDRQRVRSSANRSGPVNATLLLCGLFSLLGLPALAAGPAPAGIPGTPGAAAARDVANFSDLARLAAASAQAGPSPPQPRTSKTILRVPRRLHRLPVPASALTAATQASALPQPALRTAAPATSLTLSLQATPLAAAAGSPGPPTPLVASPPISRGFLGLEDNGRKTFPSTHGAVGPNHLLVALNSQVRVEDRTGQTISTVTLENWWCPTNGTLSCSNAAAPHVLYDPYRQRWIFTALGESNNAAGLLVAVSQTSDPTGNWNRYRYPLKDASGGPIFGDSPTVGFNTNRIVVQVNLLDSNNMFYGSAIFALNKADLYAGGLGLKTSWVFPDSGTGLPTDYGMSQVPAVTLDASSTVNYLLKDWNGSDYDINTGTYFGSLRIFSITGPVGSETFHATDINSLAGPYAFSNSPWDPTSSDDLDFLPQLGSTNLIYAGDARLVNVVYRDSTLWAAQTVFLPSGDFLPTHSAVQWWQITPGGTVLQQGRIENANGLVHFAYPSIAVNTNDDVLVGYSRFSTSQYPSANYAFRAGEDSLSSLRDDTVLKAGEAPYYSPDAEFQLNLWGDSSATVVDPANDSDLWTLQEYAALPAGTNSRWGTWWGQVSPPANLALAMTDAPDPVAAGGTLSYTLVVSNATAPTSLVIASGVKVTNTLPAGVSFISATSTQGSCSYSNGVVTCDLGALPIGGKAIITLAVTANTIGQVTNKAGVFGNGPELVPADNTATVVTTVLPASDLGLLLTDAPDPVMQSSNLTYTLMITNAGPATATAVTLTNTLPASVTFISATSTQGTNSRSGTVITYTLGSLASGASATATIRVTCPTTGTITNRAVVVSTTADPVNTNNSAQITTRVNSLPTISTVANRSMNEDGVDRVNFTINDGETPLASLIVNATSSNQGLIPDGNMVLSGTAGNRTNTITPLPNQYGSAVITVSVTDSDGATVRTNWTQTVTPVNDPPTLDAIPAMTVAEDAAAFIVNLTGITPGAPNETSDVLSVTATSSIPALVAVSGVAYSSPNATGTLTLTPGLHAYGTVTITVIVKDNQPTNNTTTRAFTVTVSPVNTPPTLNTITNLSVNEDGPQQTVSLSGIGPGAANETNTLTVTASSSDPSIIPNPSVTYTSPNPTGTLTFTPNPNSYGAVTMTVTVNDGQPSNNIIQRTFVVTVNPVNDPPALGSIASLTINEDAPLQIITLTGISPGAANETNDTLFITATSSNLLVIPNPTISYSSPATNATLSFTPVLNAFGTATITVTVNDGQPTNNIATRTFTVTVNAVNDLPTLDALPDLALGEDSGLRTVNLTGITSGAANETNTLTVTATSSNLLVIPNPSVTYGSPGTTGTLQFTPVTNAYGASLITVTVNDNQPSNNITRQTFLVVVAPVNDPPTLNAIGNITINEDASAQTVNLTGITTGATNEPDTLFITATSSNLLVIPNPTISYASPATNATLSFTPVPNAFGTATISVTVDDGQPANNTTTRTFTITVNAVNDPPTLNPIPSKTINEDAGQQTVNLTGIASGVANEVQTLTLTASNSNPALLTNLQFTYTSPASNGTLSFATVTNASGVAFITVTVNDGSPSNNLVRQTFQVTVNFINHTPSISNIPDSATDEDVPITVPFTVSDIETPANSLMLTAQSSNPEVIADSGLSFGGSGANRTITIKPLTNAFGPSTFITITVFDANGASNYTFFAVDVNPVNDPPTLSPIAPQVMNKDTSLVIPFSVNDVETPASLLTASATSSNQALVTDASLILGGSGASRTLTVTPLPNQLGTSLIKIRVADGDGATATNSFQLTVVFAPPLSISSALNQVTVSWSTNPPGFVLQSRDGLSAPTSWVPVTNTPVQVGSRFYVTNAMPPVRRFYRLVR